MKLLKQDKKASKGDKKGNAKIKNGKNMASTVRPFCERIHFGFTAKESKTRSNEVLLFQIVEMSPTNSGRHNQSV
ncbi:hypothetical protein A8L45_06120 [Veronia pacifica]|uniref:Uncharacterized protein n=1 Tax=Veronia pacifica TaxID=1080227 RepID=A0A1C3EMR6_9GAMM|nr:hypothetical protein A8L45_06120 [Veronia pacifica]